jgi:hypothetical protein
MHIHKFILMISLGIPCIPAASAQTQPDPKKQALEQLRQMRRQMLIEKLALSEEEQKNFLPLYEAYKEEDRLLVVAFRKKYKKNAVIYMTDEQAKVYLDDLIKLKDAQWQLQKSYFTRFLGVLPAKKVAMLSQVEKEIQLALKLKARQIRQQGPPRQGGPQQFPPSEDSDEE